MQGKRILLIDLEYSRDELNEPINIDTILDSFDGFVTDHAEIHVWYRTLGDFRERSPADYDLILISTKVSSGPMLDELLRQFGGKPVIVGGMLATYAFEAILEKYPSLVLSLGECECNLNGLVKCFLREGSMERVKEMIPQLSISGVAYVNGNGQLAVVPIRPCDLSEIKKPLRHRSLREVISRNGLVRIEGSRGCPWNHCTFCSVSWKYGGANWRAFPIRRTIDELVFLSDSGVACAYFTDEDFVGSSEHFLSLFSQMAELMDRRIIRPDLCVWGSTSVYTLSRFTDGEFAEFIALSKKCNIQVLFLGIESGCSTQLKRFNKGVSKEDNLQMLKLLRSHGIHVDAGFILFDAETTLEEVEENLEFCKASGLDRSLSRLSKPLRVIPHTPICRAYRQKNLLAGELDVSELTYGYRFRDEKVQTLYDCLAVIDKHTLKKANALQAELRMSGNYDSETIAEALAECRRNSFNFIDDFLRLFLHAPLDEDKLKRLMENYAMT